MDRPLIDLPQTTEDGEPKAIASKLRKLAEPAITTAPDVVESEIKQLIKRELEGVDRDQQAVLIGNHAKSVLQSATGSSRMMIKNLMEELHALDNLVANNEERLMTEIDNHVDLSIGAVKATEVLSQSIKGWEDKLRSSQHVAIGVPNRKA
jgi:hypothetical protein